VFNRLSNPILRIRVFGLLLVGVLAIAQMLSLVVLPRLIAVEITHVQMIKILLSVSFGVLLEQACFTVFVRRGLASKRAWLSAALGMMTYAGADAAISIYVYNGGPVSLERTLLQYSLSFTGNTVWTYGIWLGASLFLLSQHQVAEERQKNLLLERAQFETRLSFLESQINPHFLFNALNTVASLIVLDRASDARNAVIHLGHLLRRSLTGEGNPLATLADEIAAAEAYLAIEALRFSDRIDIAWSVEPGLDETTLPRFSLQSLIENIVKHGVARAEDTVRARITIFRSAPGRVDIIVWNDGLDLHKDPQTPVRRSGVGLRNLDQRLHLLFAGQARLQAAHPAPGQFECRLSLPVKMMREAAA